MPKKFPEDSTMKNIFAVLFLLSAFFLQAQVSFFAVNLSGEIQNCILRNESENKQPWGVENWQNEETILLDKNLPSGKYFIWTKNNDDWNNTKQIIILENKKIYGLQVLPGNIFKLDEFSFISEKKDTAMFAVINHSQNELQNIKIASGFENKSANYFDIEKYENTFFPVKKGKWKVFWEYKAFSDSYFALQTTSESQNKQKIKTVNIEPANIYLLILLPERADFMQIGTFTFPYK